MRDVLEHALTCLRSGGDVVMATIIDSSLPELSVGDSILLTSDGEIVGDLSAARFEALVHTTARLVMKSEAPVLHRYQVLKKRQGYAAPTMSVVEVFFDKVTSANLPDLEPVAHDVRSRRPIAIATVVDHPNPARRGRRGLIRATGELHGSIGSVQTNRMVVKAAMRLLARGKSAVISMSVDSELLVDEMRVLIVTVSAHGGAHDGPVLDFGSARFGSHYGSTGWPPS